MEKQNQENEAQAMSKEQVRFYVKGIIEKLADYCNKNEYAYIRKVQENPTVAEFYLQFCRITKTYFFYMSQTPYYSVEFKRKTQSADIYVCGRDYHKVAEIQIQDIVDALVLTTEE